MNDATQPATAVESLDEQGLESSLESLFGDQIHEQREKALETKREAPEDQPDGDLTADDLPDDEEPGKEASEGDAAFEIVHNGQPVKLTREQTIEYARQGFDYTQKTQAVAEMRRASEAVLQRAAEVEQMMPLIAQDLAMVKAIEAQLQQFAGIDWVGLATNDPLEYPKVQAQYNKLMQGYQAATQQFQQKAQRVVQERQNIAAWQLQQEAQTLTRLVPEWSDPQKFQAGAAELRSYLLSQGANQAAVDGLSDALAVSIARKAMLYDKLKSQKDSRSKQLRDSPPVVRPGARPSADGGKVSFQKTVQAIKRAGREGRHLAQEKAMEGLLGKTFKL